MSAIAADNLSRHFGELRAVDELSLEVAEGEIYGFLGPNGAGKTTAVKMLCTLLAPTSGRAVVAGFDVTAAPHEVRKRVGAALQSTALDQKMTGRELLRIQGRYYGLSSSEITQRIEELAPILEMDAIDRRVHTYSGGMKRRLDVAIALIHSPLVMFLDEPTTGLDPASRATVWEEIRHLNQNMGVTIFLTTQYLEEADELAGRVAIFNSGNLVAEDTPEELKRQVGKDVIVVNLDCPADECFEDDTDAESVLSGVQGVEHVEAKGSELVISSSQGAATISPVALALSAAGVPVVKVSLSTPTLDDVFFHHTGERIEEEHRRDAEEAEEGR